MALQRRSSPRAQERPCLLPISSVSSSSENALESTPLSPNSRTSPQNDRPSDDTGSSSNARRSHHTSQHTLQPMTDLPEFKRGRKSTQQLNRIKNKAVRSFYERQNALLDRYQQLEKFAASRHDRSQARANGLPEITATQIPTFTESLLRLVLPKGVQTDRVTLAITMSFMANISIVIAKTAVTVLSGSLAVIAAVIDSALDILSGIIVIAIDRFMKRSNFAKYPVGKARLENGGLMIYATVMATSSMLVIIEAVKQLAGGSMLTYRDGKEFTYALLGYTVVLKFTLWLWCRRIKGSESVKALAVDHRNDTLFNAVSSATLVLAYLFGSWIDPVGAILLSLFIISSWATIGYHHLNLLIGHVAEPETINEITFFVANFSPLIQLVDTVRAYSFGSKLIVEVDIVLSANMRLREAHDIGEDLQNLLEEFDNVERCFVHLDWEASHEIEHRKKARPTSVASAAIV